ncbi:hypothetical protein HYC85_026446 [Camellia sinensis]|uniref:ABC transmembrane type-1 domain-containing protein n=1 Tax=Camellia sinensis TaxID=4442 RepID=A0A7J7G457_CAMSI|nr:hypothetical protein HYC85_026446 [Camellia sinensis]
MLTGIGKTQIKLSEQTSPRGKPSVAKQRRHNPFHATSSKHGPGYPYKKVMEEQTQNMVSSNLSVVDLELAFKFGRNIGLTSDIIFIFGVLVIRTWQILVVITSMRFYFASAQELVSSMVSHLAESIAGVVTIRAFGEEDRFFLENLQLVDTNACPFFHKFSANEWLIQCLEILGAIVLSCLELAMTLFPYNASESDFQHIASPPKSSSFISSVEILFGFFSPMPIGKFNYCCRKARIVVKPLKYYKIIDLPSTGKQLVELEIRDLKVI